MYRGGGRWGASGVAGPGREGVGAPLAACSLLRWRLCPLTPAVSMEGTRRSVVIMLSGKDTRVRGEHLARQCSAGP